MATRVETPYTQRARYYSSLDGFNIQKPKVPAHIFRAERGQAFDPDAPSGLVACDLSRELAIGFPATAPLVLARYARIHAGERRATRFAASGALYYVIRGSGESAQGADVIAWDEGDAFCLPGGGADVHAPAPPRWPPPHRGRALPRRRDRPAARHHSPDGDDGGDAGQVHLLRHRRAGGRPRRAAVLHLLAELVVARRDAAAASAQCGGGDPHRAGRALLLHDRRPPRGLGAMDGDAHPARRGALTPQ